MPDTLYMAVPRGFCAGVTRAISLVEKTLAQYGAPIYVRHEIVHNKHVVENLRQKGVIFINNLDEVTDKSKPVIISAHGAGLEVYEKAQQLNLKLIDATCPLVARVHQQIQKLEKQNADIIVIGKKEHPEITGTIGQIADHGQIHIINSVSDVQSLNLPQDRNIGVVTQTTLAVGKTKNIIDQIKQKYPDLITADKNDICYATTHRQAAVKELAGICDGIIIVGSQNSSNSKQLQQTALQNGAAKAWLIDDISQLPIAEAASCQNIGLSAGASAPEYLVEEVKNKLQEDYANLKIQDVIVAVEKVEFKS